MRMRKCRWLNMALVALCFALPATSWALGLGEIKVESALNERFDGRIDVSDARNFGKSEIVVSMASRQDFERVGVERFFYLTYLEFEVEIGSDGSAHVNVTSSQAISEPYLNFIVEVMWPKGRLLKEYTVLLDPPAYTSVAAPAVAPPQQPVAVRKPAADDNGTRVRLAPEPAPAPSPSRMDSPERVMTTRQDTLWKIANRTLPSDRVTVHQQMLALQRKNPRAFMRDNINLLKAGYVLEIPTEPEAMETSHAMALADVAEQAAAWRENRRPRRNSPAQPEEVASETPQPEAELASQIDATRERPESPADADDGTGRVRILANTVDEGIGTVTGTGANVSQLIEEKETLSRQVDELNYQIDREKEIAANQVTVKDRQLDVKNQEIAQLQDQLRQQREALDQLQSNQNQNQNPNAAEMPWWMSPMVMFGAIGVLILILVMALISARRSRAALAAASPIAAPIEPEPTLEAPPEATESVDDMEEQAAESLSDDEEIDTGLLEPMSGDDEDSDLDMLDIEEDALLEEDAPLEEAAALQGDGSGEAADMIGEAEIYIAYGRFGQAVNLLSGVLEKEPERHDVRLKLLEVFVESNDEAGFEAHARYLADNCNDVDILQAYQQLEEQLREGAIDLSSEDGDDFADTDTSEVEPLESAGEELTLDDLEDLEPVSTNSAKIDSETTDVPAGDDPEDEFELEFEGDIEAALEESESSVSADLGGDLGMDFDPATDVDEDLLAAGENLEPESDESITLERELMDLDDLVSELDEFSLEQDDAEGETLSGGEVAVDPSSASDDEDNEFDFGPGTDADINATKIDLAEAYIDMGDADGAREILNEVIEEGTPEQRAKAQEMLGGIA